MKSTHLRKRPNMSHFGNLIYSGNTIHCSWGFIFLPIRSCGKGHAERIASLKSQKNKCASLVQKAARVLSDAEARGVYIPKSPAGVAR